MAKREKKKRAEENKEEKIFDLIQQWTELDDPESLERLVYEWTGKESPMKKEPSEIIA